MKAVRLDEQQRKERTQHCAQHVRKIEKTERAVVALLLAFADCEHGYRNGRTHASAKRDHGRRQPQSRDQIVGGRRHGRAVCQRLQQSMSPNQFGRNHQSGHTDQELKQGVESQGRKSDAVTVAVQQRSREPGPRSQSRHENGKDDGGQRCGNAKLRHRQPQPYEFAQNAAESRDKEKREVPLHARTFPNRPSCLDARTRSR